MYERIMGGCAADHKNRRGACDDLPASGGSTRGRCDDTNYESRPSGKSRGPSGWRGTMGRSWRMRDSDVHRFGRLFTFLTLEPAARGFSPGSEIWKNPTSEQGRRLTSTFFSAILLTSRSISPNCSFSCGLRIQILTHEFRATWAGPPSDCVRVRIAPDLPLCELPQG